MTYSNELYHHGVKGMKWGVRKDRIRKRIQEHHIKRVSKYRTKLAKKATKRAEYETEQANKARASYEDLKKNGKKSKAYRDFVEEQLDEKFAYEDEPLFEEETEDARRQREAGNVVTAGARFIARLTYNSDSYANKKITELMENYDNEARHYENSAKAYLAAKNDVLNTPVSEFTKKKDLKTQYKYSYNKTMRGG